VYKNVFFQLLVCSPSVTTAQVGSCATGSGSPYVLFLQFLSLSLSLSTPLFAAEMTLTERGACAALDPARCKTCPSTPGRMYQQRPRRRAFYCPAQAIALLHVRTRAVGE
jgi:hypothetical protein